MMAQDTKLVFTVEGPDWKRSIKLDAEVFTEERDLILEAATQGISEEFNDKATKFHLGPIVSVRPKGIKKEALVNSYLCMVNAALYKQAESLRTNYKNQSGQDLALDHNGYSWTQ